MSLSVWLAHGLAPSQGHDHSVQSGQIMSNSGTSMSGWKHDVRLNMPWLAEEAVGMSVRVWVCVRLSQFMSIYELSVGKPVVRETQQPP